VVIRLPAPRETGLAHVDNHRLHFHWFRDAEPIDFPTYYAPQRECQNAALLQMMQTAVEQAAAVSRPVLVNAKPATWDDAVANLAAFSDEARLKQPPPADQSSVPCPGLCEIATMPHIKTCYGWLTIHGKVFPELHWRLRPPVVEVDRIKRSFPPDQQYIALVYEYVEEGENDPDTMQKAMDVFWLAGFSRTYSPLLRNWKSGVLVELSDLVLPRGYGWKAALYKDGPGLAHVLLNQPPPSERRPLGPPRKFPAAALDGVGDTGELTK
jgi:hypothetical protein